MQAGIQQICADCLKSTTQTKQHWLIKGGELFWRVFHNYYRAVLLKASQNPIFVNRLIMNKWWL